MAIVSCSYSTSIADHLCILVIIYNGDIIIMFVIYCKQQCLMCEYPLHLI